MGTNNIPRFRITFLRYCKRRIDNDNVWIKGAIDGLVKAGWLPDDSFKHLEPSVIKQILDPNPRTLIRIERVN